MYEEQLRKWKAERGLSMKQLSAKSGVPESTCTRILNGSTESPTFFNMRDIVVKGLDHSLDELVGATPPQVPVSQELLDKYKSDLEYERRRIKMLTIILTVILCAIFLLLAIDITNRDIGYFRGDTIQDISSMIHLAILKLQNILQSSYFA